MIPKTINIGPLILSIERQENIVYNGEPLAGMYSPVEEKIYLEKELTPRFEAVVLMHEIMHGVLQQLGLSDEEGDVDRWAYFLLTFIKSNPNLISYIQETLV